MSEELSHPFSLAFALHYLLPCSIGSSRSGQQAQERAEDGKDAWSRAGIYTLVAAGRTILRGWALATQGQARRDQQMRQGLAAYRAKGQSWPEPYYLARLAEAYGIQGQAEEGLAVLAEALAAGRQKWGALV